jgi:transcriptional regulator with XRE-family HTH domain
MAGSTLKELQRKKRNADTNAFLTSLNGGPLTFGQLLASLRQAEEAGLAQFAATLGVSRQHLHQLEAGQKSVSPERAVRFARLLGQSESYFLQLALQDLANDSGIRARVQVKVA